MDNEKCNSVINEMANLINCWLKLSELFEDFTTEELDALTKDYPFEKSFDEYNLGLIEWRDAFRKAVEE